MKLKPYTDSILRDEYLYSFFNNLHFRGYNYFQISALECIIMDSIHLNDEDAQNPVTAEILQDVMKLLMHDYLNEKYEPEKTEILSNAIIWEFIAYTKLNYFHARACECILKMSETSISEAYFIIQSIIDRRSEADQVLLDEYMVMTDMEVALKDNEEEKDTGDELSFHWNEGSLWNTRLNRRASDEEIAEFIASK